MSDSFVTPWTVARQVPLSMGLSRQEYWRGFSFPPPGDLLYPGIKPTSSTLQADCLPLGHQGSPKEPNTERHCLKERQTVYFPSEGKEGQLPRPSGLSNTWDFR